MMFMVKTVEKDGVHDVIDYLDCICVRIRTIYPQIQIFGLCKCHEAPDLEFP